MLFCIARDNDNDTAFRIPRLGLNFFCCLPLLPLPSWEVEVEVMMPGEHDGT